MTQTLSAVRVKSKLTGLGTSTRSLPSPLRSQSPGATLPVPPMFSSPPTGASLPVPPSVVPVLPALLVPPLVFPLVLESSPPVAPVSPSLVALSLLQPANKASGNAAPTHQANNEILRMTKLLRRPA